MTCWRFSRRSFLKVGPATLATAAVAPSWLLASSGADPVEYRVLGRTNMKVSTVSLGCGLAGEEVIAAALDRGVNWLDTGHSYKNGRSEEEVGRVMRGRRHKAHIATKIQPGPPERMRSQIDISLSRLRTDYVDNLMLHDVRTRSQVFDERSIEVLLEAKEAGKARSLGIATHRNMAECISLAIEARVYDVVLTTFNYTAVDSALLTAVKAAHAAGIGVIAMKTQLGNFPNPRGGLTPHQGALKWVLDHPFIACAIPGMRDFEQLDQNLAVMGTQLGMLEREELEAYARATSEQRCDACGRCGSACPMGVDIPDVRRCAMYLEGYGDGEMARESYRRLTTDASACASCSTCSARCSAGADLKTLLQRTHQRLA